MKSKINALSLVVSAFILTACGGSMLGSSDAEDYKMIPDVVTEDPNPQRPSPNVLVMKTSTTDILLDNNPVLLRGINLQYGDDPLGRFEGIQAVREVGSNVIRLLVKPETNESNLEAALVTALSQGLFTILTLDDAALNCNDDETAFGNAVKDIWLKRFLPVIHQDRFQSNLMINIARGWGPGDIYNGYSTGYKIYIDNYKTAIRAFRNAGFKVPLVIDAPCGTDYFAFDSDRGKELLASDSEKNLVLSVHAYGSQWNNNSKLDNALSILQSQRIPFVMSEFGGSGVEEGSVKHKQIIEKAAGDYAAVINVPWKASNDKVAIIIPLEEAIDITGTDISFNVLFDKAYVDEGNMGFQMYIRDSNNEYANIGWNGVWQQTPDAWNTIKASIKNRGSFGWASDSFDMTRVVSVGLELVANGKSPDVGGIIKFDNFKIIEGSGAKELLNINFENDITGWVTAWEGTEVALASGEGVALTRASGNNQVVAIFQGISGVDFTQPVQITANIFFPAGYSGSWTYGKFFNSEGEWLTSSDMGGVTYGAWNEVILTADFGPAGAGLSSLGIQIGNLGVGDGSQDPDFYGPILIKDLKISGIESGGSVEEGVIYNGTFETDEDNWAVHSWGDSGNAIAADGSLNITAANGTVDRIDIQHRNPARIEGLNFNGPFTLKTRIFIPAYYESIPDFLIQFYLQDSNWSNHFDVINVGHEGLVFGDWNSFEVEVEFPEGFNRDGLPQHMGFSFSTSLDSNNPGVPMSQTDPIRIDEIIFEGLVPVEKEEVVIGQVDFYYTRDFAELDIEFVEGEVSIEDVAASVAIEERSRPFSWLAWSWFGNPTDQIDWDLSETIEGGALTQRGEDIVNGRGGIKDFAPAEEEAVVE